MTEEWGHLRVLPPIPTPPKQPTRFSTVAEVTAFLRISNMSVYRLIHSGELPAYRFGRTIRIPTQGVWDYVRGQKVNPENVDKAQAL